MARVEGLSNANCPLYSGSSPVCPTDFMKCPYCNSRVILADSSVIYGRSYGNAYICSQFPKCSAYVGCHPGTDKPLGRLADKELRKEKMRAHAVFDRLWNLKIKRKQCSRRKARLAGYKWLANKLGIRYADCHIGLFDLEKCRKVIELCTPSDGIRKHRE